MAKETTLEHEKPAHGAEEAAIGDPMGEKTSWNVRACASNKIPHVENNEWPTMNMNRHVHLV